MGEMRHEILIDVQGAPLRYAQSICDGVGAIMMAIMQRRSAAMEK